jgi:hypothetical protein
MQNRLTQMTSEHPARYATNLRSQMIQHQKLQVWTARRVPRRFGDFEAQTYPDGGEAKPNICDVNQSWENRWTEPTQSRSMYHMQTVQALEL